MGTWRLLFTSTYKSSQTKERKINQYHKVAAEEGSIANTFLKGPVEGRINKGYTPKQDGLRILKSGSKISTKFERNLESTMNYLVLI